MAGEGAEEEPKLARYDGRQHLHELHPDEESSEDLLAPAQQLGGHATDGVNRLPELFALLPPDEREKVQEDYLVAAVEGAKIRRGMDSQSQVSTVGGQNSMYGQSESSFKGRAREFGNQVSRVGGQNSSQVSRVGGVSYMWFMLCEGGVSWCMFLVVFVFILSNLWAMSIVVIMGGSKTVGYDGMGG